MSTDNFFKLNFCTRCAEPLERRTMSWFNTDVICMSCKAIEDDIRSCLPERGKHFEDCGYIPQTVEDVTRKKKHKPWVFNLYKKSNE